jgi:hypothetical protein
VVCSSPSQVSQLQIGSSFACTRSVFDSTAPAWVAERVAAVCVHEK